VVEHGVEFIRAHELLRQRDVREMVGIEAETRLRRGGRESLTEPDCLLARIGGSSSATSSASSADMLGRLQH